MEAIIEKVLEGIENYELAVYKCKNPSGYMTGIIDDLVVYVEKLGNPESINEILVIINRLYENSLINDKIAMIDCLEYELKPILYK